VFNLKKRRIYTVGFYGDKKLDATGDDKIR
jgi:hypothetical protein